MDAAGCSQGQTRGSRRFHAGCTGCLVDANRLGNTGIFFFHYVRSIRQTNVVLEHTTRSNTCHRHADESIPLCGSLPDWAKIMEVCVACLECADEGGSPHPLFQIILPCDVADIYFGQVTKLEWSQANLTAWVSSPDLIVRQIDARLASVRRFHSLP